MLTALTAAPCQPLPGPLGAAWPSAKPGIEYCGPYPSCCPAAAAPWWQHLLGYVNPHGDWSMIALEAVVGVLIVFLTAILIVARARARRRRWEPDWLR